MVVNPKIGLVLNCYIEQSCGRFGNLICNKAETCFEFDEGRTSAERGVQNIEMQKKIVQFFIK